MQSACLSADRQNAKVKMKGYKIMAQGHAAFLQFAF
jgi:hypothetical protein